jgi:putative membrane protein
MENVISLKVILASVIFSSIGLVVMWVSFILFDKLTPGELWHEIVKEKNLPLAVTASAMILAIAQIVAAAIHG